MPLMNAIIFVETTSPPCDQRCPPFSACGPTLLCTLPWLQLCKAPGVLIVELFSMVCMLSTIKLQPLAMGWRVHSFVRIRNAVVKLTNYVYNLYELFIGEQCMIIIYIHLWDSDVQLYSTATEEDNWRTPSNSWMFYQHSIGLVLLTIYYPTV